MGWHKRDQKVEVMTNMENHGQSLNAEGDRNDNSVGHAPVDDEKIHSHGFYEVSVSKGDGPPDNNLNEAVRKQDDLKLYGSIGSSEGTRRSQQTPGKTTVVNNNSNAITVANSHPVSNTDVKASKNYIDVKTITNKDSNGGNSKDKTNTKTEPSASAPSASSDGGHAPVDPFEHIQPSVFSFSQNEINKGLLSHASHSTVASSVENESKETGISKSHTRDHVGTQTAPIIIVGQPNVQLMPVMARQALGQSMPQGGQPLASVMPVIPPQGNLLVSMLQQPTENAERRGVFLQPMQQIPAPLVYSPVVMPSQPRYFGTIPQYFFPSPEQFQPQEQSTLFVSPHDQIQQQPMEPEPADSQVSNLFVSPSEPADKSRDMSAHRWVDEQGHSRSEVMDDSEDREYEERKEREREESDEQQNLYGNDSSEDYGNEQGDEDDEGDRPAPEPEDDRESEFETEEDVLNARDQEGELPGDEDVENYDRMKEKDPARMRFLRRRYPAEEHQKLLQSRYSAEEHRNFLQNRDPAEVNQKFLQSRYAQSYPADDVGDDIRNFPIRGTAGDRGPPVTTPVHFPAEGVTRDSPETFLFAPRPPVIHSVGFGSDSEPYRRNPPSEPVAPQMTADTYSRFQVTSPESELKPGVLPLSLPDSEISTSNKDRISLAPNMKITQMSADQARFMEGRQAALRMPISPLSSKDSIPRGETHDKTGFGNSIILLNGKPLEDGAQLRSRIVNGKIVQGKGKIIKSKGPVRVRLSHTKDSRHMKIINIIAPQQYHVIDTKNTIGRPNAASLTSMASKRRERI